ncbi:MAG: hypothetical protein ACKOE8_02120 [Opitutaceae bacterium]
MNSGDLGERIEAWAQREKHVELLVAIGSRVRAPGADGAADRRSDWDYQLASSRPEILDRGEWLSALGVDVHAYAVRIGRLGSSAKISVVTDRGELDLVILPAEALRVLTTAMSRPAASWPPQLLPALTDLATVLAGGFRVLKGEAAHGPLLARIAREVPVTRLDDAAVRLEAEGFVCDYVSTWRKVERGEWIAAQRWLHHQLTEANLRLLHELRLRRGGTSFPDGRRLERLTEPLADEVTVRATPEAESVRGALPRCAAAHRRLVEALLGETWRWPDLSGLRLGGE